MTEGDRVKIIDGVYKGETGTFVRNGNDPFCVVDLSNHKYNVIVPNYNVTKLGRKKGKK